MGKKDKDFKFIVGNPDSLCSKVWSVKIRKNDVYIMDAAGKDHKISLHESGICHSAVTRESASRFNLSPSQRRTVEWKLKNQIDIAFAIVIHNSQLSMHNYKSIKKDNVYSIPIPAIESAVVIDFIKIPHSSALEQFNDFKLKTDKNIHYLHHVQLDCEDIFVVRYQYTLSFNKLVIDAQKKVKMYAKSTPLPLGQNLSSGFVTVCDAHGYYYRIDINLH